MLITNYYKGANENVTGITFDTEKKTYKNFVLKKEDWSIEDEKYINIKEGFKIAGDINYYFNTKKELLEIINNLKTLEFKEDKEMVLDFGVLKI